MENKLTEEVESVDSKKRMNETTSTEGDVDISGSE